jgi:serine/threonine protein kinase
MPVNFGSSTILANRYELLEVLGTGGFGKVWRARDRELGRLVAVKVFHLLAARPRDMEKYFEHERQALARLQHPGVVAIHAAATHEGRPFLVMDLLCGRSLADVVVELSGVARGSPSLEQLSQTMAAPCPPGRPDLVLGSYWETAARITAAILRTLEATHAAGVLHRDIKPSNVMLTGGAHPVLLDFGMASLTDLATGSISDRLIGTVNYLAPEQIRAHRIGRSVLTDIYQVGLTMYELLTLRPAFSPADGISTIPDRILRGDFVRPRQLNAEIPELLEAICLRAVEHHPERRFASATAFREALELWLRTGAVPPGVVEVPLAAEQIDPADPRRYVVQETLIRSAFETVQRARDRFLDCEVVLKRPGPDMLSPNLRQRVRQEAERLMKVRHPAIARLHGVIQDGGDLVLVLDPMRGAPLAERLRAGPLPVAEAQRLGRALCGALTELHRAGIVHCCLGPETVWITPDGEPCLASLTFARDVEGRSSSSLGFYRTRPGAPSTYLAPEQTAGRRPDARADVFALGCLLYRCLTGVDPDLSVWPLVNPRKLRKEVSRAFAATVLRCMNADPTRRFNTAAELAAALG